MQIVFVLRYHLCMKNTPRPPGDRGQGRKPLMAGAETVTVSIRMTPEHRAKLERLGGAPWVRGRIEKAKEATK